MKKILLFGTFTANMTEALYSRCPDGFEICEAAAGEDLPELADADYIVNRGGAVDLGVIQAAKKVKLIQKWGAGYDKIDIVSAGRYGIPVAVCVGGNSLPVAELTVSLMLNILRNVLPMAERLKKGEWSREMFSSRSYLLHGKTVGLIGIGNIARRVAGIVKNGFGANVIYYDVARLSWEQEKQLGLSYSDLDELLAQSDVVSIHVPLLESTEGMIDRNRLRKMKPTACLVNTSRGGVINEPDLISALREGEILGAGLDTFASEPLSQDSPLLYMDNVVTTPHCGGNTVDNDGNMAALCMENISRYDTSGDKTMSCIVNQTYLMETASAN